MLIYILINKCEAVVEILQDDKIRDHLNKLTAQQQQQQQNEDEKNEAAENRDSSLNKSSEQDQEDEFEDEEEMLEMLEMQEECRMEMMKFYIQSQNPNLFENVYHDMSYPDVPLLKANETTPDDAEQKLKQLIVNELNTDSSEFVPKKFSD